MKLLKRDKCYCKLLRLSTKNNIVRNVCVHFYVCALVCLCSYVVVTPCTSAHKDAGASILNQEPVITQTYLCKVIPLIYDNDIVESRLIIIFIIHLEQDSKRGSNFFNPVLKF